MMLPQNRCGDVLLPTANLEPFISVPANIDLNDKNIAMNEWQRRSEKFNFAKEDEVPDMEFNAVLWHGIKGNNIPLPAPKRSAFLKVTPKKDGD